MIGDRRDATARPEAATLIFAMNDNDSAAAPDTPERQLPPPTPIVGIGASAGGVDALSALFEALPGDTGLAYIVVLHLDPKHASFLTEILATNARMPVTPAQDGLAVEANHVYVITPNTTLTVSDGQMRVRPRSDETRLHLPVDALFASLAEALDSRSIGVLLSGTGSDGTLGAEAIKAKGGITFAQDQGTARFFGMPGSAVASGCVDYVLAPGDIAKELVRIARHPYLEDAPIEPSADEWKQLFRIVRGAYGVDFASYKRSTIRRRLLRRLALSRVDSIGDYLERLVRDTAELQALYQDLLIRVTSFFRDPETFDALAKEVFPSLVEGRSPTDTLRIWVPGCATGEEVYSIAIALHEFLGDAADTMQLQIFGTDVNPLAIERARAARYVQNIEVDIAPERLRRFFVRTDDHYEVAKRIRDACIFAVQNVGRDPPFSRLDLVSCRNLLIYLDVPLQKRVIQIFHYALNADGFLVLGPSETIGQGAELFQLTNQRQKIYQRIGGGQRLPVELVHGERGPAANIPGRRSDDGGELQTDRAQKEADQLLITRFAPAALLIDDRLCVVHFRGHVAPYLEQQPGTASLQLSKLVHPALLVELVAAIEETKAKGSSRRENLRVANSASGARVDIEVSALKGVAPGRYMLILFEPHRDAPAARGGPHPARRMLERLMSRATSPESADEAMREHADLQRQVDSMRSYLTSIIEANEAAQEELRSANEEVLSANEEFQSTNEELETAKEELQSANEELATTNEELSRRNDELAQVNEVLRRARDYSQAIVETVRIPLLLLNKDLRVRAANRAYCEHFRTRLELIQDVSLLDLDGGAWKDATLRSALLDAVAGEREVAGFRLRITLTQLGQRTLVVHARRLVADIETQPDLLLVSLEDVTEVEWSQRTTRQQAELLDQSHDAILVWELAGPIRYWNRGAQELYGWSAGEAIGKAPDALLRTQRSITYEELEKHLLDHGRWAGEEEQTTHDGRRIIVDAMYTLTRPDDDAPLVLETSRDITERKRAERLLREQDQRKDEFLAMLGHELRNPLAPITNALELLHEAKNTDEIARLHGMIERQVGVLSRIVDDLIDVARVTRGHIDLRLQNVDLRDIVGHAVESTRADFERQRQRVAVAQPDTPVVARVDPGRVEQVVVNLLSNASRYSPESAAVDVALSAVDSQALIRVRDEGIGIAPEDLAHIFEPFMQVARSANGKGLGIGLTLVKRIAELHHGSVEARSHGLGEGSEFIVRLPLGVRDSSTSPSGSDERTSAAIAADGAHGHRVLVLDDNEDSRESIAALIESWGCVVKTAADGNGAIAAASAFHPDVVLLDIGLPDVDGREVARRIRALPGLAHVFIIAMTGYGSEQDRQASRKAGIDRHMVKPVDLRALARMLERLPESR